MPTPLNILLVDDDFDDREMFIEVVLEIDSSVKFLTATNGNDALQQLIKTDNLPDIIFLDLNMPRMNGFQCLQHLKNNERYAAIPVIMYTTSGNTEDKEKAKRLGALKFLTKPSCIKLLKEELEKLFKEVLSQA